MSTRLLGLLSLVGYQNTVGMEKKAFTGKGKRQPDKADFYILEQENKKLKEENDILKKFEVFVQRKK